MKKKKKEIKIYKLCFKYSMGCKWCPRQQKCEKEIEKERKNVIQEKGAEKEC